MRGSLTVVAGVGLAFVLSGCASDDGAVGASASGSSSASAMGSSSQASSQTNQAVPAGVASQYAILEEEIAAEGGDTTAGPWRVAYIVEPAEPWFESHGGHQGFRAPAAGETHHLEIIPIERSTGRIMPETPVTLQVLDQKGNVVDAKRLNFYYSEFFHYANNFSIPQPGTYTLRAHVGAPTFLRHGEHGDTPPMTRSVTVTFPDVELDQS
jgi:hypothetical protein